MSVWSQIIFGVQWFIQLVQWVLLAYCVLSWFVAPDSKIMRLLARVTDPILEPIRMLMFRGTHSYRSAMFAPIAAYFLLSLISSLLYRLL